MPVRRVDVPVGTEFGRLVVVRELPTRKHLSGGTKRWFLCRCDCGVEKEVRLGNLRSGHTVSCGRHSAPPTGSDPTKRADYHGMKDSSEYGIWEGMKDRCYKPRTRGYKGYGGRGIAVCSAWRSSFKSFFEDIGARPSSDHSIDRIDGDGNYSCGHCEECIEKGWVANCRWATRAEQRRNQKDVRMLTFQGETMCMADWAKRKGMSKGALWARLDKMSVEEALRKPVREWKGDKKFQQVPESERDAEWRRDAERRLARIAGK